MWELLQLSYRPKQICCFHPSLCVVSTADVTSRLISCVYNVLSFILLILLPILQCFHSGLDVTVCSVNVWNTRKDQRYCERCYYHLTSKKDCCKKAFSGLKRKDVKMENMRWLGDIIKSTTQSPEHRLYYYSYFFKTNTKVHFRVAWGGWKLTKLLRSQAMVQGIGSIAPPNNF